MTAICAVGVTRLAVDPKSVSIKHFGNHLELKLRREQLYEEKRLDIRWHLFEFFTLPSLEAAATRFSDFVHLLAVSSIAPDWFRERAHACASRKSGWLKIIEINPDESFMVRVRDTVSLIARGRRIFNYRVDDDDALSPDFIDVLKGVGKIQDGQVLSFDRGIYVQRCGEMSYYVQERDYPKIAIALGVFCSFPFAECVFDLPVHTRIPTERVVNIRDKVYWLRTLHGQNDSGTRAEAGPTLNLRDACSVLTPRFGHITLQEALPALPIATETSRFQGAKQILYRIQ
jgi:hypothetical protein